MDADQTGADTYPGRLTQYIVALGGAKEWMA